MGPAPPIGPPSAAAVAERGGGEIPAFVARWKLSLERTVTALHELEPGRRRWVIDTFSFNYNAKKGSPNFELKQYIKQCEYDNDKNSHGNSRPDSGIASVGSRNRDGGVRVVPSGA